MAVPKSETEVGKSKKEAAPAMEVSVTAAKGAVVGVLCGVFLDVCNRAVYGAISLTPAFRRCSPRVQQLLVPPSTSRLVLGSAVWVGLDDGLCCVMKLAGKEDVHTRMVASFGSTMAFAAVSGMARFPVSVFPAALIGLWYGYEWQSKEGGKDRRMA